MSTEPAGNILPVYFVADESGSMAGVIDNINNGLANLVDTMLAKPMVSSKVRFSVIGFSDSAFERLPISDLREINSALPKLFISGGTSYRAAFTDLKDRIQRDVDNLKSENYQVHRPAVFFLSDGYPTDTEWESSLNDLTSSSFKYHPNIIAFGMGEADPNTVAMVASKPEFAFMHAGSGDPGVAVTNFMESLTHSIMNSGQSFANGESQLLVEQPEDFVPVDEFLAIQTDVL